MSLAIRRQKSKGCKDFSFTDIPVAFRRRDHLLSVFLSGDTQLPVAAEIVQVPIRGRREPKLGPTPAADEVHSAAAVSYTHLDVYKRQT